MIWGCLILLMGEGGSVLAQTDTGSVASLEEVARKTKAEQSKQKRSSVYTNDVLPQGEGGFGAVRPASNSQSAATAAALAGTGQEIRNQFFPRSPTRVVVAQNTLAPVARTAATQAPVAAPAPPAQTAPASSSPEKAPDPPVKISYVGGQLRIDALDSTLRDVLVKVAALIGVKIEIPPSATSERLPFVKLGPGPARQTLAALLSGSSFDYLIQASDTDPEGIQNVVLVPREKRGAEPGARSSGRYAKAAVSPSLSDETPEPNSPVPAEPYTATADAGSVSPAPAQPDQPAPQDQPTVPAGAGALINRSGLTSEGAMPTPSSLDPESINQQLQQMYQQRAQMNQQQHPSTPPPAPANPQNQ